MILRSRRTGQQITVNGNIDPAERSRWRFKKQVRALERVARWQDLEFSFLTLTVGDAYSEATYAWVSTIVHAIVERFRRRKLPVYFVGVLEIQPKRYAKWGQLAPHWHLVFAAPAGSFPHGRYDVVGEWRGKRKQHYFEEREGEVITFDFFKKQWKLKHGQFFVCDAWSRDIMGYLGKYLDKTDPLFEEMKKQNGKLRRFNTSKFPLEFQLDAYQMGQLYGLWIEEPDSKDLYWRRCDNRLVGYGKEVREVGKELGWNLRKSVFVPVMRIPSEWQIYSPVVGESLSPPLVEDCN